MNISQTPGLPLLKSRRSRRIRRHRIVLGASMAAAALFAHCILPLT